MAAWRRTIALLASAIALSQQFSLLLKFLLTTLSRLLKLLDMADTFDYRKAYEQVSHDLKNALEERESLDRKIQSMRQTLTGLEASCESLGIEIEQSAEAMFFLESSSLPEEILAILRAVYP